jgi:hypothetical protein
MLQLIFGRRPGRCACGCSTVKMNRQPVAEIVQCGLSVRKTLHALNLAMSRKLTLVSS